MQSRPEMPTVYLVGWDDERIIKTGSTMGRRRWRRFERRGATLHYIRTFPGALACEQATQVVLGDLLRPAFKSRREAAPYLSGAGGGYTECFQAPDQASYRFAVEQCKAIMLPSIATEHCQQSCHVRTDVQTNVEPRTPSHRSIRPNAHKSKTEFQR